APRLKRAESADSKGRASRLLGPWSDCAGRCLISWNRKRLGLRHFFCCRLEPARTDPGMPAIAALIAQAARSDHGGLLAALLPGDIGLAGQLISDPRQHE